MTFAYWRDIPTNTGRALHEVLYFVIEIPGGIIADEVHARVRYWLKLEELEEGEISSGFSETWPEQVRHEFKNRKQIPRLVWTAL